jgi:ABC-type antimicrobial peptide transport system permease subunit
LIFIDDLHPEFSLIKSPYFTGDLIAVVAVVLAAIGIYSVVAWAVAQRTREVGIRLALGASPDAVVTRLIRQGLMPVAIGVGLGLVVSFGLARVLASQLAQIKSYDPITYLLVSLFLGVVALLACWLPARRAARVDPMTALRTD